MTIIVSPNFIYVNHTLLVIEKLLLIPQEQLSHPEFHIYHRELYLVEPFIHYQTLALHMCENLYEHPLFYLSPVMFHQRY